MKELLQRIGENSWSAFATGKPGRMVALSLLVTLNLYLTVTLVLFRKQFTLRERAFWLVLIWVFPIAGAVMFWPLVYMLRKYGSLQRPDKESPTTS